MSMVNYVDKDNSAQLAPSDADNCNHGPWCQLRSVYTRLIDEATSALQPSILEEAGKDAKVPKLKSNSKEMQNEKWTCS